VIEAQLSTLTGLRQFPHLGKTPRNSFRAKWYRVKIAGRK
jgi:hypothetical protein